MIYARNRIVNRRKLWKDIKQMEKSVQGPWMIMGDFNNVLYVNERIGGKPVQEAEFQDL